MRLPVIRCRIADTGHDDDRDTGIHLRNSNRFGDPRHNAAATPTRPRTIMSSRSIAFSLDQVDETVRTACRAVMRTL
jgi:hypothetical protein